MKSPLFDATGQELSAGVRMRREISIRSKGPTSGFRSIPEPPAPAVTLLLASSLPRRAVNRWTKFVASTFIALIALMLVYRPATATEILTYTFQTTNYGNAGGHAVAEFSYVSYPGDFVLTGEDLIAGFVRFIVDGAESSYGDFVADDRVFGALPLNASGWVQWSAIGEKSGVASTVGPPGANLGSAGGVIGANPFTGSLFAGQWNLSYRNASDFDADGDVDGADFLGIQRSAPIALSDWSEDYGADPTTLQQVFGSVPEPSAAVSLLTALFVVLLTQNSRRNLGFSRRSAVGTDDFLLNQHPSDR